MAFSFSPPKPLHTLTRYCCFYDTCASSTGLMPFFYHGSFSPDQNNATHILNTLSDDAKETTRSPPSKLLSLLIMENFAPSTILANFNHGGSNMGCSDNFDSSMNEFSVARSQFDSPEQYRHQHESLQCPYVLPSGHDRSYTFCSSPDGIESWVNSNPMGFQCGVHEGDGVWSSCFAEPKVLSELQEQKIWDSCMTKAARSNRKLVRETDSSLRRNPPGASYSIAAASGSSTRRLTLYVADTTAQNSKENVQKDAYTFCTPDNKKLRVLLKKELKNSDVGNLGRIVLPKREAEANLPSLSNKEGIPMVIIDVYSNREWGMRFRYWTNNKSRMYVLENTGDFVKQNALENGDCITLYEDEGKNLYFSIKRAKRPACEPSNKQYVVNYNYNYLYAPNLPASKEDETYLALLIEELRHKEQPEANSLVMLPTDDASSSYRTCEEADNSSSNNVIYEANSTQPTLEVIQARMAAIQPSSSSQANMMGSDGHQNDFNDCFSGLGTLPEVSRRYRYSLFDQLTNELPEMEEDDMMIGKPSNLHLL